MDRKIFSPFENELLIELVRKKIDIIENKETNKVTSSQKAEAFAEIAKQFNSSLNVTKRTSKQLRQRYLNLKKTASKKSAVIRQEHRMTGGGENTSKSLDGLQEEILSLGVITTPLTTPYDSDCSHLDLISSQESELLHHSENISDETTSSENHEIDDIEQNEVPEVEISINEESSNADAPLKPPYKRPRVLNLFRRKATPKKTPTTSSARTAEVIIEEAKLRMEYEKKRDEREEKRNEREEKRNEREEKKNEREEKRNEREEKESKVRIQLLEKQIEVQREILEILKTNPGNLSFNLK